MSKPELVSFVICPFVQRSVITLLHKNVDFDLTYIDLANKPDWFQEISPLGKVPVLKVGDDILFESAVINEYLDETTGTPLHPSHAMERAKHRAWIEFGSATLMAQYRATAASNAEDFASHQEEVNRNITRFADAASENGPFFAGENLSLVDTAVAPLLMRYDLGTRFGKYDWPDSLGKAKNWWAALSELGAVKSSVREDFDEQYKAYFEAKNSFSIA